MQARIISLGDIVTLNIAKTVGAFTTLIAGKKSESNPAEVGGLIGGVLQTNMNLINDFKLGKMTENEFNEKMIAVLETATGVKLSTVEFDSAWNAMLPTFNQFEALLNEAITFNKQPGQKIIFISFTNPKDIRHLVEQLKTNKIAYKTDGDQLTEIDGIKLLTTYAYKKSKAELIEVATKELRSSPAPQSSLATSMSAAAFNIDQYRPLDDAKDIKYIRAVNDLKDPVLKEDVDKTNEEVEKRVASFSIETIIWKKFEKQPFSDVLNRQVPVRKLQAAML